ncbi:MAG: restriction endonuclease subunit R, partial [candidate division WOR-3 bacterium]
SGSLFDDIKKEGSKINILIGSKKFIEGWDTWRVSSMGLLNIGRGQGPQIIQLFGRGVRLKGKGMSLKRSGSEDWVKVLETLNIYGIKADYLNRFLDAIRREDVEFETIEVPVEPLHRCKWNMLPIISKSNKKFEEEKILRLEIDLNIPTYEVNLLPKVSIYQADVGREGIKTQDIKPESKGRRFPEDKVNLFDWQKIYVELLEFKMQREYWNLVFDIDTLKNILLYCKYSILSHPEIFNNITSTEDIKRLEDIALLVIKKYIDLFYRKNAKQFETENLSCGKVQQLPLPFISERKQGYIIQIDKKKRELVEKIKKLTEDFKKLIKEDTQTLPRIYFDGSLYVPILLQSKEIDKISPAGLVESEKKFVMGLREYLEKQKDKLNVEVYLLRNYPFSGVGFQLQWSTFYPDFIMWIMKEDKQIIVFTDPKGLEHTKDLDDEKIQFAKEIKNIEKNLKKDDLILESFIFSITPYKELIKGRTNPPSKEEYITHHVLFAEDEDWASKLFSSLGIGN